MNKFIHTFKVSSGKGRKKITKVYNDYETAWSMYQLLGGKLESVQVNAVCGKVK